MLATTPPGTVDIRTRSCITRHSSSLLWRSIDLGNQSSGATATDVMVPFAPPPQMSKIVIPSPGHRIQGTYGAAKDEFDLQRTVSTAVVWSGDFEAYASTTGSEKWFQLNQVGVYQW
jgi:hypothetical protein